MSTFDNLKMIALRAVRPVALTARRHAPEILMAAGVTGLVTTGVLLVKQTLNVQPIIDEHKEDLIDTKEQLITPAYSEEQQRADITKVYLRTAWKLTKLYGPTVSLGAASIVALLASNGILKSRNVALAATYKALESSFGDYRKRVEEFLGEDKERDIYRGFKDVEEKDEETGEVRTVTHVSPEGWSIYSKFFDELSGRWHKNAEYNLTFLRAQENFFNDLLRAKGYVFLNEVYQALDIPETQVGNHVGWTINGDGDGYIDFGIYDFNSEEARAFVNGYERSIHLDFNVDGVILNAVPKY